MVRIDLCLVQIDLGTVPLSLGTVQIGPCTVQIDPCTVQIGPCTVQIGLGTVQIGLGTVQIDLGTVQIDLGTVQIDLGTVQIRLRAMQAGRPPVLVRKISPTSGWTLAAGGATAGRRVYMATRRSRLENLRPEPSAGGVWNVPARHSSLITAETGLPLPCRPVHLRLPAAGDPRHS